jgi:uncharacterized protein (TIGR02246 family)
MKADARIDAQVRSTLRRFADAYAARDLQAVMGCFAEDDNIVLYGTGADEKRVGPSEIRTQVERDWAQTDRIAMVFERVSVVAAGRVAWAAVDGAFNFTVGDESGELSARMTFVLEERNGEWSIAHAHFSVPAAGQEEGHSV